MAGLDCCLPIEGIMMLSQFVLFAWKPGTSCWANFYIPVFNFWDLIKSNGKLRINTG